MNQDANGIELEVGNVVVDPDGYEGRVTALEGGIATLDYDGFASDVPAEATEWPTADLELVDEA